MSQSAGFRRFRARHRRRLALLSVTTVVLFAGPALLAAASATAAPPANDAWGAAVPLAFGEQDVRSNQEATTQADEPMTAKGTSACVGGNVVPGPGARAAATIWYRVHGVGAPITVDLRDSQVNTLVAAYDASLGAPAIATAEGCQDDIGGPGPDTTSELVFWGAYNTDYLVQVGTKEGTDPATGNVDFIAYDAPVNDFVEDAEPLAAGRPLTWDNVGATTEDGEPTTCGSAPYDRTVWFFFSAPAAGRAVVSAAGGFFDSVLAVYSASTGNWLGCNDDGVVGQEGPSRLSLALSRGVYLIQIGGYGQGHLADYGRFTAQVEFTANPPSDRDGDGIPDTADRCPDQNARARDANGDGCLDALPPPVLKSKVVSVWYAYKRYSTIRTFKVTQVPAAATIKVTCRARPQRRCPYAKRKISVGSPRSSVNLVRPFRGRRLPVGTRLEVTITASGYVGKVYRYKTRSRKPPRPPAVLCLAPGAKRPGKCP